MLERLLLANDDPKEDTIADVTNSASGEDLILESYLLDVALGLFD